MNKGVLLFAHNSPEIDYGLLATISGGLAKKNLSVPVTLATDKWTIDWLKTSGIYEKSIQVFEQIIEIEKPYTNNTRKLHDGFHSKTVPFTNFNRCSAWDISPYEKTLLIDSDYMIFSNSLNEYWNLDNPVMLSSAMNDIVGGREGILDKRVSETGIPLYWATTVMFDKSNESKLFFELVSFIRDNYRYYADLYRFDSKQYRNDIAFSVASHILNGFEIDRYNNLPPVLTISDKDILHNVEKTGRLTVLLDQPANCGSFWAASLKDTDIHIMNKQSIIRNKDALLELI